MFNKLFSSPKTTWMGILSLISIISSTIVVLIDGDPATNPDWTSVMAGIGAALAAIGLVFARDNNVTSENAGLK